jgi:hypothetical protein
MLKKLARPNVSLTGDVVVAGPLDKKGELVRAWKRRHVVVTSTMVAYFDKHDVTPPPNVPHNRRPTAPPPCRAR